MFENLSKTVPRLFQNTSKIDLEGGLEAAREPALCRGDPKTPCFVILALNWDTIWGPVLVHVGHNLFVFFWYVFWIVFLTIWGPFGPYLGGLLGYVFGSLFESLRKPWHARKHQYLLWFSHVGAFGKSTFLDIVGIIFACFLVSVFWEGSGLTFWRFWTSFGDPFEDHFGHFWGTVLGSIFGGFPELSQSQRTPGGEGDLVGIWGPETGLHQQDKQIYRWKSADL